MGIIILSIHLLVCLCLIGLVLLQRSEGGALGMGGGGGSLMSGRGAADALARMTSVAGGFFLVTSLGLTMLSGAAASNQNRSVFDLVPEQSAPVTTETAPAPTNPDPTESSVPSDTQVAALTPATATPTATTTTQTTTARAAPLETTPPARATPAVSTTNSRPPVTRTPSNTSSTPATTPAATRTTPPQTQRTPPTTARTTPAVTTTDGAVSGITLTDGATQPPESGQTGLEAVRRERAGPDQ